jgi:outer membrane protein OmpA-like peptidoglycan-associated protein
MQKKSLIAALLIAFASMPVLACKPTLVADAFFANGAVALDEKSRAMVIALVEKAMAYPIDNTLVIGFGDISEGDLKSVKRIATARAEYVKSLMVKAGFPAPRIFAEGKPATGLRASPDAWQNRRVELEILYFPPGACGGLLRGFP